MSCALAVDLGAAARVRRGQVIKPRLRHHQAGLGIADEVLRDPPRFRVGGRTGIRAEPVMAGEPYVLRR
jgi:hypothetical protein